MFYLLSREFEVEMKKDIGVLSPGFQVLAIDEKANARKVNVDVSNIYHGSVKGKLTIHQKLHPIKCLCFAIFYSGDSNSFVQAYFEEDDEGNVDLDAKIETNNDIYLIEVFMSLQP